MRLKPTNTATILNKNSVGNFCNIINEKNIAENVCPLGKEKISVILFWIISNYYGDENLGLFTQMNKYVKAPIILITSAVSQLFFVEVSKAINDRKPVMPFLKQTLKTTVIFGIPFTIVLFLFAPQMFSWYFGSKFVDYRLAGEMVKCNLPILFLMFIVSPVSSLPILFKKQKNNKN